MTGILTAGAHPSAGGAPAEQLVILSAAYAVVFSALVLAGLRYRAGHAQWIRSVSERIGELTDKPYWSGLPLLLLNFGRFATVLGFYWDMGYHIKIGRDPGPLTNPTHYLILVGVLAMCTAGVLLILLPKERPGPVSVRIARDWYVPVGGVLVLTLASLNLFGFTLDDLWHRIYGQDLSLWSPTHIVALGSGGLTTTALLLLLVESQPSGESYFNKRRYARLARLKPQRLDGVKVRRALGCGSMLIALSIFPSEFDAAVPQFRMVFQPMMILFVSAMVLTLARVWLGRGAAFYAVGFFLLIRVLFELWIDGIAGMITIHFPLYLAEAAAVEITVGLLGSQRLRLTGTRNPAGDRRALAAALIVGLAVGIIGFTGEYGWSRIWMAIPWNEHLIPLGLATGVLAALAGATIGAWMANALRGTLPHWNVARKAPAVAVAVLFALIAFGLHEDNSTGMTGKVTLADADTTESGRWVHARIEINDAGRAERALWLREIAWQGGDFIEGPMRKVRAGVYETIQPLPVFGSWKSGIRLQTGSSLVSVPIFMPGDPAIPAPEIPAPAHFTRDFVNDRSVMQRESKLEAGTTLAVVANGLLLMFFVAITALIGWGYRRVGSRFRDDS